MGLALCTSVLELRDLCGICDWLVLNLNWLVNFFISKYCRWGTRSMEKICSFLLLSPGLLWNRNIPSLIYFVSMLHLFLYLVTMWETYFRVNLPLNYDVHLTFNCVLVLGLWLEMRTCLCFTIILANTQGPTYSHLNACCVRQIYVQRVDYTPH